MSWNGPGKQNNNNDGNWGNNQNQKPPELDEILRNFQDKLRKMFGGSERPPVNAKQNLFGSGIGLWLIAAILIALYVLSGIYIVEPAEVAVVKRFGEYNRTTEPGPHWLAPIIESKDIVNIQEVKTTKHGGEMITSDKNIVSVEIAVQYRIREAKDFLFNVTDPVRSLKQVSESALRTVVGQSILDEVLSTGRTVIAEEMRKIIQENLDYYQAGLEVSDLAMQQSKPPEAVKDAFDDAIKAGQDEMRLINQAEAYANKVVPIAEGRAKRILEEANAYKQRVILDAEGKTAKFAKLIPEYKMAPGVTRERMYLDAMQEVYANSSKVVVDVEGGNNLFYLPLDKLAPNTNPTISSSASKLEGRDFTGETINQALNNQEDAQGLNQDNQYQAKNNDKRPTYQDMQRYVRGGYRP